MKTRRNNKNKNKSNKNKKISHPISRGSVGNMDFWDKMAAYEAAPYTTNAKQLNQRGIQQVDIEKLSDAEVRTLLWEVIKSLESMRIFLNRTDHLSDRELYQHLWSHSLQEEIKDIPIDKNAVQYIDLIGGGSDEDFDILLKYYADDEEIEMWRESFPDMNFPSKENLPYNRDALMPHCEI